MIHQLQSRKLSRYPNFTIGLISPKERAQQTNQEKPPVKESESNVKNDIVKQLDKPSKNYLTNIFSNSKWGMRNLAKPETNIITKK